MATLETRIGRDITEYPATKLALEKAGITTTKGVFAILEDGSKPLVDIRVLLMPNNKNYVVVGTTPSSGAMGTPNPVSYKLAPMGKQDAGLSTYAPMLKAVENKTWTYTAPQGGRRRRTRRTRRKSRARKSRRSRK
jgi:hypothetical protein